MRIPNVAQAAANLARARLRRLDKAWRVVLRASERTAKNVRRRGEIVRAAPALTRARVERAQSALVRGGKRLDRFDVHVITPYRTARSVKRQLRAAASGSRPVIVGPWTSEVGYEALYWLPFLHWACDRYGVHPSRVVALSRGGTQSWYAGVAARYVEIFDLIDPAAFAAEAASRRDRGDQKQMSASAFDLELVHQASARLGLEEPIVWHPGLMYQMFRAFWYGDRSLDFLMRHADFGRVRKSMTAACAAAPPLPGLPPESAGGYAAVKFYTGQALPDTPANRDTLYRFVERLAARMPVVLLDTAWSVDEHRDYSFDAIPGVTTLRPSLDPASNLGLQTQVIAGARLFLGTCGGLAWLAPLLGVDTLAIYEDDRYLTAHLYAARYAYRYTAAAPFSALNVSALRRLQAPAPAGRAAAAALPVS
jgi:hypothetical protein